jgi:hypothetical protein
MILAECNEVYVVWLLGYKGIDGNEIVNQLAKMGSLHQFIGPEPACGISGRVGGWAIRDWVAREHQRHWQSIPGQKHAMGFLNETSTKRITEPLKFSRVQIRQVTGLLTGHCHLSGHLFQK